MKTLAEQIWEEIGKFTSEENKHFRVGQKYMTALYRVNPDLYVEVSYTSGDCFYDDSKIPVFWDFINIRG
jgi:hypothetical protein